MDEKCVYPCPNKDCTGGECGLKQDHPGDHYCGTCGYRWL